MSKIRLHGSSSGYTEIAPVAASGNNTLTLPNDGTIISKDANGAVGVTSVVTTTATITTAKVGAAVTISESGIEASGIGITVANINGTQIGGRRNIIINGAMQVAQRGTSTSSWTGQGFPACDRQKTLASYGGAWTISQSTEAPSDNGFTKSTKYDCTTAVTSLNANAYLQHYYRVEGHDLQGVRKGTSNAKALTLSFWVKTNKTGTYNVEAIDQDNSRLCSFSYTVSDSNWNKYTVTFPADTTGAFGDDSGASLDIGWWLVAGTTFNSGSNQNTFGSFTQANRAPSNVNLADSTSNEWYITGIQLELGSEATAFEHRSFGEELSLCQRYYYAPFPLNSATTALCVNGPYTTSQSFGVIQFPTTMRAAPSGDITVSTNYVTLYTPEATGGRGCSDVQVQELTKNSSRIYFTSYASNFSSATGGSGYVMVANNSFKLAFTAEL